MENVDVIIMYQIYVIIMYQIYIIIMQMLKQHLHHFKRMSAFLFVIVLATILTSWQRSVDESNTY